MSTSLKDGYTLDGKRLTIKKEGEEESEEENEEENERDRWVHGTLTLVADNSATLGSRFSKTSCSSRVNLSCLTQSVLLDSFRSPLRKGFGGEGGKDDDIEVMEGEKEDPYLLPSQQNLALDMMQPNGDAVAINAAIVKQGDLVRKMLEG